MLRWLAVVLLFVLASGGVGAQSVNSKKKELNRLRQSIEAT